MGERTGDRAKTFVIEHLNIHPLLSGLWEIQFQLQLCSQSICIAHKICSPKTQTKNPNCFSPLGHMAYNLFTWWIQIVGKVAFVLSIFFVFFQSFWQHMVAIIGVNVRRSILFLGFSPGLYLCLYRRYFDRAKTKINISFFNKILFYLWVESKHQLAAREGLQQASNRIIINGPS